MKKSLKKVVLILLMICSTVNYVPLLASQEEYSITITQLESGEIMVSSDTAVVLDGFISLTINRDETEVVFLKEEARKDKTTLIFIDPGIDGQCSYSYDFKIGIESYSLNGSINLASKGSNYTKIEDADSDELNELRKPEMWVNQDNVYCIVGLGHDRIDTSFQAQYSTRKNGGYKKIKSTYYWSYSGSDDEEEDGFSHWEGEFKVVPGKLYYIRARAYYQTGNKKVYSKWVAKRYRATVAHPKEVEISIIDANTVNLSWSKAKGANRYEIFIFQGDWNEEERKFDNVVKYFKRVTYQSHYVIKDIGFDFSKPFDVDVVAYNSKKKNWGYGPNSLAYIEPSLLLSPVYDITTSEDIAGSEIRFEFSTTIDLKKYKPVRGNWDDFDSYSLAKIADKPYSTRNNDSTDKYQLEHEKGLHNSKVGNLDSPYYQGNSIDFNLWQAKTPEGPWKRVETTADYKKDCLAINYAAESGEKYYYKILPTWEAVGWSEHSIIYAVNFANQAEIVDYTLYPGIPQNIVGKSLDFNKVQVAVDKGVAIVGYELVDASTGALIKTQKSNIFAVGATFNQDRTYKIRSYRLSGKTKVYSEFSNEVTVKATLRTPIIECKNVKGKAGQIKVSWKTVPGATSYVVYVDDQEIKTVNAKTLALTVTGLSRGVNHDFRVEAVRGSVAVSSKTCTLMVK